VVSYLCKQGVKAFMLVQAAAEPQKSHLQDLQLSLYVRWFSPTGKTKVNRLLLRPVTSVEALEVHACPHHIILMHFSAPDLLSCSESGLCKHHFLQSAVQPSRDSMDCGPI
jgi:hypothetical protein